jgi:hypothetical protein
MPPNPSITFTVYCNGEPSSHTVQVTATTDVKAAVKECLETVADGVREDGCTALADELESVADEL